MIFVYNWKRKEENKNQKNKKKPMNLKSLACLAFLVSFLGEFFFNFFSIFKHEHSECGFAEQTKKIVKIVWCKKVKIKKRGS